MPTRKFFISTLRLGKSQSPSVRTVIECPFGTAIHRSLVAPSDQNGALIAYGTNPAAGCCALLATTHPVSLRFCGTLPLTAPVWNSM